MIALSPTKLVLSSVLFFLAGLETHDVVQNLGTRLDQRAIIDILGVAGALNVAIVAITKRKRVAA